MSDTTEIYLDDGILIVTEAEIRAWIKWTEEHPPVSQERMPDGMWPFLMQYGGNLMPEFGFFPTKANCMAILKHWLIEKCPS